MRRLLWCGGLGLVLWGAPLAAQLEPVGAPGGTFRFDLQGAFESADHRLFPGGTDDYLADFSSPALGSGQLPFLSPADSLVGLILNQPGYRLNLGAQQARGQLTIGTGTIGGALGITSWLTLSAHVPFVTTRVQAHFGLDSTTADAGINPAHPVWGDPIDQTRAAIFFTDFGSALDSLNARIARGDYGAGTPLDALARTVAAEGTALRDALVSLTTDPGTASPFTPSAASPTGLSILDRVRDLQDTLATVLSVPGFTGDPVLAASRLTEPGLMSFLTSPSGPIAALPLGEARISRMGDMDVGATVTLVNRFDRGARPGGLRFAVSGLLRLPTGIRDNPDHLFDVGTGNGRYEAGVSATADAGAGRWGARLRGGYLARLAAFRVRRVAAPGEPYAPSNRLANVRMDAGDVLTLGAEPFFRLARNLALTGVVDYARAGRDRTTYNTPADTLPGLTADLLSEPQRSRLVVGGGLSYVGRAARECPAGERRRCGLPVEGSWRYETVIAASGGRAVKLRTVRFEIRWYQRLWH